MSVRCQNRKSPTLFDHLVGAAEQRRGDIDAECLGSLQVDRQFELGRKLDWQIQTKCVINSKIAIYRFSILDTSPTNLKISASMQLPSRSLRSLCESCSCLLQYFRKRHTELA
jgi:hypothetical protein